MQNPSNKVETKQTINLGICSFFRAEADAIAATEDWRDVVIFYFPATCERPLKDWKPISQILSKKQPPGEVCCLAGADCLRHLGTPPDNCQPCTVHCASRCFDWLIGAEATNVLIRGGAWLLTPGWLSHWQNHIQCWGFDQATARQFFNESMKKLVLLDTGVNPQSAAHLQEFSAFVGLPSEILPTRLDMFRLHLRHFILEERLNQVKRSSQTIIEQNERRLSEYAMAHDLIWRLASIKTEQKAIHAIMDMFAMLFAPSSQAYLPLYEGVAGQVTAIPESNASSILQTRLAELRVEYAWTPSERGFLLCIGEPTDPMGVLEVEGIAFAQYRFHYLNLALSIARVCGLAIQNARAFEKIENTVRKLTTALLEREHMEEQLREARKLESVGTLAGGIAHEYNNILAAIIMQLSMMDMTPNLNAEVRECLEKLQQYVQRAATLTRQILLFGRSSVVQFKEIDLDDLLDGMLLSVQRVLGSNIKLRFQSQCSTERVKADPNLIEQVITNLALNARDAMPKGGQFILSTEVLDITSENLSRRPERKAGRFLCLAAKDTGCGMKASILKRIFDPFYTTKDTGKGSGMGLSTVYGIVKRHDGWIEVDSQVGKGSLFQIYFPVSTKKNPPAENQATLLPANPAQATILLVDDDPEQRRWVAECLKPQGFRVLAAANMTEVMELWNQYNFQINILITDIILPQGVTGLELASRLHSEKPGLQVIITCGYGIELAQQIIPKEKGYILLSKPLQTNLFVQTVHAMCISTFPALGIQ